MTATAAEAAMFARWKLHDAINVAANAARDGDSRLAYLERLSEGLQSPATTNFVSIVANATTPRAARAKRVARLSSARFHQIGNRFSHLYDTPVDFGPTIRRCLRDAAMWRMMEKSRAETEAMRAEFDRIERIA